MSGGIYEYASQKVNDMAYDVNRTAIKVVDCGVVTTRDNQEAADRTIISRFLYKVAEAMRALEWCDSGDTSWEDGIRDELVKLGVWEEPPENSSLSYLVTKIDDDKFQINKSEK